jgi:hypothetical protein
MSAEVTGARDCGSKAGALSDILLTSVVKLLLVLEEEVEEEVKVELEVG